MNVAAINSVLKILCRENGIERDRKAVMQVSVLLLSLWKQGVHDQSELERVAREKWLEAMSIESTRLVMNSIADLLASARTVHDRYRTGRMERETVREWAMRLGSYPAPHCDRVKEAADWFRSNSKEEAVPDETRLSDLKRLAAIFAA
ncbi:hypothetical protein [Rhizobium sp. Root1220]|uniref:hypothetical protein n=1 Tax=Rhizobium sp. Root1220 TaxID=1736432 RepID=UPI000A8597DB|nr:hypothetical protein [Rhizobium sp. Root1220]